MKVHWRYGIPFLRRNGYINMHQNVFQLFPNLLNLRTDFVSWGGEEITELAPYFPLFSSDQTWGGGVTTIYAGTGCAIFWGAFFGAENKFWGIIFGKITSSNKFWGVILENNSLGY